MLPPTRFDFLAPVTPLPAGTPMHFIAIGGSGMSGVARLFLERGSPVSGSDARPSPTLDALAAAGATVHVGHDATQVPAGATVVVSSAVRDDNPELLAARRNGALVLHRSQAIAALLADRRPVAVAGANGKTTTSAMLAWALRAAGADPGFVIGAPLAGDGVSATLGSGPEFVVEADESDSSFLSYHPQAAVVTNIRPDHLDHFGDLATIEEAFRAFIGSLRPGGGLVVCQDDPGAARLGQWARGERVRVTSYGTSDEADVRIEYLPSTGFTSRALVHLPTEMSPVELAVPMPGRHNILNATAAYLAAVAGLGVADRDAVLSGLSSYPGAHRRFQRLETVHDITVVDDYAHNPDKVAAVVAAGRAVLAEGRRLVVAFQPHLYSRTRDFAEAFAAALAGADLVLLLEVYGAREDPIPGVSSALIGSALQATPRWAGAVEMVTDRAGAAETITAHLRPGDLLLTVGAGDITQVAPEVVRIIQKRPRSGGAARAKGRSPRGHTTLREETFEVGQDRTPINPPE